MPQHCCELDSFEHGRRPHLKWGSTMYSLSWGDPNSGSPETRRNSWCRLWKQERPEPPPSAVRIVRLYPTAASLEARTTVSGFPSSRRIAH